MNEPNLRALRARLHASRGDFDATTVVHPRTLAPRNVSAFACAACLPVEEYRALARVQVEEEQSVAMDTRAHALLDLVNAPRAPRPGPPTAEELFEDEEEAHEDRDPFHVLTEPDPWFTSRRRPPYPAEILRFLDRTLLEKRAPEALDAAGQWHHPGEWGANAPWPPETHDLLRRVVVHGVAIATLLEASPGVTPRTPATERSHPLRAAQGPLSSLLTEWGGLLARLAPRALEKGASCTAPPWESAPDGEAPGPHFRGGYYCDWRALADAVARCTRHARPLGKHGPVAPAPDTVRAEHDLLRLFPETHAELKAILTPPTRRHAAAEVPLQRPGH